MNTYSQRIKSILYLISWVLLIAAAWYLWLSALHYLFLMGDYIFVIIFGTFVGVISKLSPNRVFLVCFFGFFIIAPLGFYFSIFEDLVFLGILCGLFGIAGAIIRRIITHQRVEELYLTPWEWALLIGGVSILADYIVIPCAYAELFTYHRLTIFSKFFISSLIGLFALGVYTGIFYHRDYKKLMKSVAMITLGGHGAFLIYRGHLFVRHINWELFLLVALIVVFFDVVLIGAKIGYSRSGNLTDLEQST